MIKGEAGDLPKAQPSTWLEMPPPSTLEWLNTMVKNYTTIWRTRCRSVIGEENDFPKAQSTT